MDDKDSITDSHRKLLEHKEKELSKETLLFTKPGCQKCDHVKQKCDLSDVKVVEVNFTEGASTEDQIKDAELLSTMAFHEIVRLSEKTIPILVTEENVVITGAINIEKHLLSRKQEKELEGQRI